MGTSSTSTTTDHFRTLYFHCFSLGNVSKLGNIFGTVDLIVAITTGTIYNAVTAMGPAYWIPGFWVPLLLVTHYVTFVVLRRGGPF